MAFMSAGDKFALFKMGKQVRIQWADGTIRQGRVVSNTKDSQEPQFLLKTCRSCNPGFYPIGETCTYEGPAEIKTRIDAPGYLSAKKGQTKVILRKGGHKNGSKST